MNNTILELKDISYYYDNGTMALERINISIPRGKKVAFLGPNGSGKSTLFLVMNGVLKPQRGALLYKGEVVSNQKKTFNDLWKKIGLVFQDPEVQLFSPSVFQEISFGPKNLGLSNGDISKRVEKAMEEVNILHLKDKPTHFLSCGQKKRVSIADILVMETEIIILDEPTASLDCQHIGLFHDLLAQLNNQGKTILLSTHDVNLAYEWADYIYIIKEGRVLSEGTTESVFQDMKALTEAYLQKPWVLEIYEHMVAKGKIDHSPIPRSKEALLKCL